MFCNSEQLICKSNHFPDKWRFFPDENENRSLSKNKYDKIRILLPLYDFSFESKILITEL